MLKPLANSTLQAFSVKKSGYTKLIMHLVLASYAADLPAYVELPDFESE